MAKRVTPRRRRPVSPGPRLVLDSGGLIALSRDDPRARAFLATRGGAEVIVPAVVVAETVRGNARDAAVNRILAAIGNVVSVDEALARSAGSLIGSTKSEAGAVDALVVASSAAAGGGIILTSDVDDPTTCQAAAGL